MCGIAGVVDFAEVIGKQVVEEMLGTIVHRGPDSAGVYTKGPVGLGIRRLSIIDLKTGDQPIFNEDKSIVVVFNGEIYNFKPLRSHLEKKGHKFATQTDTEVLVHLYEDEGENLVKRLNGMFAFALWDSYRQRLVLARDHVGIKPLYVYKTGKKLVFGSEVKAVLKYPGVDKKLSEEAINLYSYLGYVPAPLSIYRSITKLLPGQVAVWEKSGLKLHTYYRVTQPDPKPEKGLSQIFDEVVKRQSIADVPVGLLLSGGLDSSLIAYFFTRHNHQVKSFSVGFEEKGYSEADFAQVVARHLGTDHYSTVFSARSLIKLFPQIAAKLDEPLADPSLFPTFEVSKLAAGKVKVALSGDGGDELFGGYPTYQGHLLASYLPWLIKLRRPLLALAKNWPARWGKFGNYPLAETAIRFLAGLDADMSQRHLYWMSMYQQGQALLRPLPSLPQAADPQGLDIQTYLTDDLLVKTDRASMFNSLEVRVPFLDREVITAALNMTGHVDLLTTKKHLRRLLAHVLPDDIVGRKKKGFGIPLASWLRDELRGLAGDWLASRDLDSYFDRRQVDGLWREHLSERADNSKIIWMLVMFSVWQRNWA